MTLVKVAETSEILQGQMKVFKLAKKEILIANVNRNYHAIANRYTHKNGDLSKGSLDGNSNMPRTWCRFDVTTGKAVADPKIAFFRAKTNDEPSYQVKIERRDVMINLK